MTTTQIDDWKELATREGDGLTVSLHWNSVTGRVKVAITDLTRNEACDFEVAGPHALDAYNHPFAYATGRGLGFGDATRRPTACSRF